MADELWARLLGQTWAALDREAAGSPVWSGELEVTGRAGRTFSAGTPAGPGACRGGVPERGLAAGQRRARRRRVRAAVAVLAGRRRLGPHPRQLRVAPRRPAARAGL